MLERKHFRISLRTFVEVAASAVLLFAVALAAHAQTPPATVAGPLRDPWVPPELRKPPTTTPAQGAELRAQAERKLKAGFDAVAGSAGTLTRAQATAGGLGFIAGHFDEIDQDQTGAVRFADVKRFLKTRGAQLN